MTIPDGKNCNFKAYTFTLVHQKSAKNWQYHTLAYFIVDFLLIALQ